MRNRLFHANDWLLHTLSTVWENVSYVLCLDSVYQTTCLLDLITHSFGLSYSFGNWPLASPARGHFDSILKMHSHNVRIMFGKHWITCGLKPWITCGYQMASCQGQHTKRNRKGTCQEEEAVTTEVGLTPRQVILHVHHTWRDIQGVQCKYCILIWCQA